MIDWGRLKQDKYIDSNHTKATAETFGWIWCARNEMNSEESEIVGLRLRTSRAQLRKGLEDTACA